MNSKFIVVLLMLVFQASIAFSQEKVSTVDSLYDAAKKYESVSDLYNASVCYSDAIKCARKEHNKRLPDLLIAYCRAQTYLGDYSGALLNIEEAESCAPVDNDTLRGRILTAYGTIYFFQGNFDEALKYYDEALKCAERIGDKLRISTSHTNIACIYGEKKEYDKAIDMFTKSLEAQEEAKDYKSVCITIYNIAQCHMDLKEYEEASKYFNKALDVAQSSNKEIATLCYQGLAKIEINNSNYDEAERLLDKSESIAKENSFGQAMLSLYKERKNLNVLLGRYREAYECLSKYQEYSDSLFSEDTKNKLNSQRVRFELREKELLIEDQKNTIEKQNLMRIYLIVGIGLLLIFIILITRIWRIQRLRNKELEEMNHTKDKFMTIISHDLKNPAIAQRNAMQAVCDNFDNLDKSDLKACCSMMINSSDEQLKLIFDLLNWSQMELGRIPYNPANLNLASLVDTVVRLSKVSADNKHIKIITDIPDDCTVYADRNMIETVLRNLITNAIKFSHENSEIKIFVSDARSNYMVSVLDYGVGIPKDKLAGIFSMDSNKSTVGTGGEVGNGLGLSVCDQMVRKNGGIISVESEVGKFTQFNFTIVKAHV